jgi:hypothetical protein
MRSWVLAASLLAATFTTGARAADLDEGPPPDRYGSAYDDPRYADIYKYPRGPIGVPPPGAYGGPYSGPYAAAPPPYPGPVPRERVYRDEDEGPGAYPGPRRYSYAEPTPPYAGRCAPRELVKQQLYRDGWRDFHDGDARGGVATVRARRPSGRLFELTLDRCSGQVVRAEPLEGRASGPYAAGPYPSEPYAYGPPPRRWDRAY